MATVQELEAYLTQARTAYHRLIVGGLPQTVREADGSTVVYQLSSEQNLSSYITSLESQIASLQGGSSIAGRRRPILVAF